MELEIKNLTKSFSKNLILKDISFKIQSGKALGFLGRNGAGKTTTIRCLMNIFKPDSGTITLNNKNFNTKDYKIGYLPEERGLYAEETVFNQLVYLSMLRGFKKSKAKESVKFWLEKIGLTEYKNKKLELLSKGNQQKVQIIQAFINDPDIYFLDEPFSGLDPINAQSLKNIVREKISENKLVIFSSHQMSYVEEFCDDIAIIQDGKIKLTGDLLNIKRQRSLDKYKLITKDKLNAIKILNEKDIKFSINNSELIIESKDKFHLLNLLINNSIDISLFSDYLPTLDQIFIETAGEQ